MRYSTNKKKQVSLSSKLTLSYSLKIFLLPPKSMVSRMSFTSKLQDFFYIHSFWTRLSQPLLHFALDYYFSKRCFVRVGFLGAQLLDYSEILLKSFSKPF